MLFPRLWFLHEVQVLSEVSLFSLFWQKPQQLGNIWDNWKTNVTGYLTQLATGFINIILKLHQGFALRSFQNS